MKLKTNINLSEPVKFALKNLEQYCNSDLVVELVLDGAIEEQGYKIINESGKITVAGADEAGFMYGILDLAKEICHKGSADALSQKKVIPYLKNRGIKFNIPLDARTPSYSDASDSASKNIANMWDFSFWTEFIDNMALNKYNVLSLWTLSPFPSLVRIPEYPEVSIDDVKRTTKPFRADTQARGMYSEDMHKSLVTVKKMTIDEKISFWRSVMEYAMNRCVKIYIFTWNLFIFGMEGNPYGIECDQDNPVTKDMVYHGTKALMDTYPLLAGIGVTTGENMKQNDSDVLFISDTYGRGVRDYLAEHPDREFRFIHRTQMTSYKSIINIYKDFPCPFEISFKYSQAHMYANTNPSFINSFLKEKSEDIKIWLTVRNDDFYMYRWGNPEFAFDYLRQMPVSEMTGYYMGPDGFTWGLDYLDVRDSSHPQVLKKMWYMFMIWGQLSYNLNLTKSYFVDELKYHFGKAGEKLYDVWKEASDIIPEFNRTHWHDFDFQWYPEGCCMYNKPPVDKFVFADINEFVSCRSAPESGYYSVREYCEAAAAGKELTEITPAEVADSIMQHAEKALLGVAAFRESLPDMPQELEFTIDDIEALAFLGKYYSTKLKAAVSLCSYRINGNKKLQSEAVELLKEASLFWKSYSAKSKSMYKPQVLTRMCSYVDLQLFDELAELDVLLAAE